MTMTHLLIADDLTGGNDSGIQFVRNGLDARLVLNPAASASLEGGATACAAARDRVLVLNTDTRNLPAAEAGRRMRSCLDALNGLKSAPDKGTVFKKIDSTLRGNLGLEIDAVIEALGFGCAFLAPSYPAQGRRVESGMLLVNGVPVDETEFAHDPNAPVTTAHIPGLLARQSSRKTGLIDLATVAAGPLALDRRVRALRAEGCSLLVFDAATQGQLADIARVGLAQEASPLFVGAAGLASEVAQYLAANGGTGGAPGSVAARARLCGSRDKRTLFVCGSASSATREQLHNLAEAGNLDIARLPGKPGRVSVQEERALAARLAITLAASPVLLAAPLQPWPSSGNGGVTAALARVAAAALAGLNAAPGEIRLFLTGGETALAVLERLGVTELRLEDELFPGIVQARVLGGSWNGMTIITKAGGFGDAHALARLLPLMGL